MYCSTLMLNTKSSRRHLRIYHQGQCQGAHRLEHPEAIGLAGAHHQGVQQRRRHRVDPFCGCGTALVAAENLGRRWVGADDDANAVDVIRNRIASMSGQEGALPIPVSVLYHPPQRTEVATDGDVIRDPTGIIIPKMPSDKMSNAAIRDQLMEWQQQPDGTIKCPGCGECLKPRHFHVDHINPKSAGGTNRIDNRILLCGACNTDKGNTRTLPHLWNEQQIRGRQRQEMQRHVTEIQNQARAHVRQMDAGAPAPAPLR